MVKLVFDAMLWDGKDVGDNSQFWKPALILRTYEENGEELADVMFQHDGRISRGHFVDAMNHHEGLRRKRERSTP